MMSNLYFSIIVIIVIAILIILAKKYNIMEKIMPKKEAFSLDDKNPNEVFVNGIKHMIEKINITAANYIVISDSDMKRITSGGIALGQQVYNKKLTGLNDNDKLIDELLSKLEPFLMEEYSKLTQDPQALDEIQTYIQSVIRHDFVLLMNNDLPYNPTPGGGIDVDSARDIPSINLSMAQKQTLAPKHHDTMSQFDIGPSSDQKIAGLLPAHVDTKNLLFGIPRYGFQNARQGRSTYDPRGLNPALREMVMKMPNSKDINSLQRSAHTPGIWSLLETSRGISDEEHTNQSIDYYGKKYRNPEYKTHDHLYGRAVPPITVTSLNKKIALNTENNIFNDMHHGIDPVMTNLNA